MSARIAVFAGPSATILNTPPLVTGNRARAAHGLPLLRDERGRALPDALRPQRLAAPVTAYVEQFSAHPLEADSSHLYGEPDGYVDAAGRFSRERSASHDRPVYEVRLEPGDGLYPLPYMARQRDGSAWDDDAAYPGAPDAEARQPFMPDARRLFEEVDRLGVRDGGVAGALSALADYEFFRVLPPGGYRNGAPDDAIAIHGRPARGPEVRGVDFFPYRPYHLMATPPRAALAAAANAVREVLGGGGFAGALWLEASPTIEETLYWLSLVVALDVPLVGVTAQRAHGELGSDTGRQVVDAVRYIRSDVWRGADGRDAVGPVVVSDQRVFAARSVEKVDSRPGGYRAAGFGGPLGNIPDAAEPLLHYRPAYKWGATSDVCAAERRLDPHKIPLVRIVKDGYYSAEGEAPDTAVARMVAANLELEPLAGFVAEGTTPYANLSPRVEAALHNAVHCGMPVVCVGRGSPEGPPPAGSRRPFISGGDLSATKARMLLTACMLRFGAPTNGDVTAYQDVFDSH